MRYRHILTLFLCIPVILVYSQSEPSEGVYLSFAKFKKNDPLLFDQISVPGNVEKYEFILAAQEGETFVFFDSYGLQKQIPIDSVWALYVNKNFYVKKGVELSHVQLFGVLSFFSAKILTEHFVIDYNPYYPYNLNGTPTTRIQNTSETKYFILNCNTGEIFESTIENFEDAIKDDVKLLEEYKGLKNKKKKEMLFYYMRLYNKNHQIKFEE